MTASDQILDRLLALHPKKIDLSLGRLERLLGQLGNPHLHLPPVIHVAGTNGKGSTIAFMRAVLEAAGRRVHVYTSPHLVRFHERIRLGAPGRGQLVDEADREEIEEVGVVDSRVDPVEEVDGGATPPALRAVLDVVHDEGARVGELYEGR